MCASVIAEEKKNKRSDILSKHETYEEWLKNGPKLTFGEYQLLIDIYDLDDFFIQKAKKELRETPENIAKGLKELREMLAGNENNVTPFLLSKTQKKIHSTKVLSKKKSVCERKKERNINSLSAR